MTQLSFDENAMPQTSLGEIVVRRTSIAGADLRMRTLTDEQEQAVARRSEPLLLAAGAGSGKTSVLVERVGNSTERYSPPPSASVRAGTPVRGCVSSPRIRADVAPISLISSRRISRISSSIMTRCSSS